MSDPDGQTVMVEPCRVPAVDGYQLGATVTRPTQGSDDWVVVSTAFGTAAGFYAGFAQAVAEAGLATVTYDYRGVAASRPARMRRAQDIPTGAARQMAAAILRPGGVLADPDVPAHRYAKFTAPVLAYSIEGDEFTTVDSVDDLAAAYPNCTRRHIRAQQAGLDTVGHFGYFRPRSRALWADPIAWPSQQPARHRP